MKVRQRKFLEALPKHNNKVKPAAIAAGYTEQYAHSKGKYIYEHAVKAQAREIIDMVESKEITNKEAKQLMSDIVGLSKDNVMERLRNIATQERDYSSALKVLSVLARDYGIQMDTDAPKVTVPMLNVSLTQTQPAPDSLIEP